MASLTTPPESPQPTNLEKEDEENPGLSIEVSADADEDNDEEAFHSAALMKSEITKAPSDLVHLKFVDHFSLKQPSSTVRYRSKQVQVYDLANDQLQLEHEVVANDDDDTNNKTPSLQVTMHRMRSGSIGLRFLRTIYTLVALLMLGYMMIFAAQAIAYQAMEIPRHAGQFAGQELRIDVMIATILSLPLLGYSMATLMVMATAFVTDCWNGHMMFALLVPGQRSRQKALVMIEWFSFVFYIAVPVVAVLVTNFMKLKNWWEISAFTWYISMNFSFLCFCALVFYHEIKFSLDLTKQYYPELGGVAVITKAVLTTLTQSYCATKEFTYLVQSDQDGSNNLQDVNALDPISSSMSLFGYIKTLKANPFFDTLEPPIRRYSLEEMRESVPYITNQSWSLEKMCCKLRIGRSRFVIRGPNALDLPQYRSTLSCNFLNFLLATLFIIAIAYGMGQGVLILVVLFIVLLVVIGWPLLNSARQLVRSMPDSNVQDDQDAPAFYQAWASFTVAKPKEWYCWMRLGFNFVFLFAWPVVSLYISALYKAASLFLVTSLFSGVRLYLDAGSMICERGSLSNIELASVNNNNKGKGDDEKSSDMLRRARAAEVLGKVTYSPRKWLWFLLWLGVGAYFTYSGATSLNGEDATPQSGRETIVLVDGFYYPPQPDISYTTCELHKAYAIPGQNVTYTMDYNFLAGIAYETPEVTKYVMDQWFGKDEWVDEVDFVTQWKKDNGKENSHVSFRLFSKRSNPGVGILSIRGTETPTDAFFNALLYSSSFLTHFLRLLMPFSWLWTDIYDELIATTSWIASDQLKEIGYYRETTDFANDLLRNNYTFEGKSYNWLRTTGVSLGGGLALITGAQSDAYGLGISGMNPVDARRTFVPPLEMDALNTQVLNIIPETDFISNMGTKVRNFETVACRTWPAKRYNCHSFWRIFCEYSYSCGTPPGKPAYCICVDVWGYPEPLRREGENRTFAEACAEGDAAFRAITGGGD